MFRSIFSLLGTLLFDYWGWTLIAAGLGLGLWQNRRKVRWLSGTEYLLLMLEIPKANEKKELAAEQLFASLHGILRPKGELLRAGGLQEHVSFEIASIGQLIRFYVWTPKHLKDFVEGQIYAQYPGVHITELDDDYAAREHKAPVAHSAELTLNTADVLPIKTFPSFEVDPLAAITATLAKLEMPGEELWIQILARPVDDSWHRRGARAIAQLRAGRSLGGFAFSASQTFGLLAQLINALFKPPEATAGERTIGERAQSQIKAIEEKSIKLGYEVKVRICYLGPDQQVARLRMQAIVGTFKQFNSTNLNGFRVVKGQFGYEGVNEYRARFFPGGGFAFNIEELASLWHLPHTNVETPNIVWTSTKTAEPPATLPTAENSAAGDISLFGATNFRARHIQFGIKRSDRDRHLYILGQTGTGKSGLLRLLTLSDVYNDIGFGVIDPHGDYALDVLRYIPEHRLEQVIYINPADTAYPIAFNPLEVSDPSLKNHISSELVGVLKRMFESWGPRLEYILRYTLLALLDYPEATMLDITRMLTEKSFRQQVVGYIQDPVVKNFWTQEFASWNDKFATEAVAPVLNKVGAFTANPMIRNIIGQPRSSFNLRKIMDEGKILVVNLSRGLVGEDNAAVLGALMVTKIQLAAMSRADLPEGGRRPFYLYVDEFQNFATDSFAVILSEARKYGLTLTVANQYVSQMTPEVKDAIFGNVGSLAFFRVGADDATMLGKYVMPQFEAQDLMNLHNRHFVSTLTINGEKTLPFSGTTLNIPPAQTDFSARIIEHTRATYAKPRDEVAEQISKRVSATGGEVFQPPVRAQQHGGRHQTQPAQHHRDHRPRHQTKPHSPAPRPADVHKGSLDEETTIHLH
jgi:hypothetical protein